MEVQVPRISLEEIDDLVQSASFWKPHVQNIANHFKLSDKEEIDFIVPSYPGDNAVFIVEGKYIIKFFADGQFTKGESFHVEMFLYSQVFATAKPPYCPQFIGRGSLSELYGEKDTSIWGWPFLVTSLMHGKPLKLLKEDLTEGSKLELAVGLGDLFKHFHSLDIPQNDCGPFQQDYFEKFIDHRLQICIDKHKKWKHLTPRLLEQLPSYLPSSAKELLGDEHLVLIHGDLHHEHAFISLEDKDGQQHLTVDGLIDFGDSCLGSPLYEFVFMHLSSFRSNKKQLKAFLDRYYPNGYDPVYIVRKCFCYTLLHEFNAMNLVEEGYILDTSAIQSLEEFATLLWDVTCLDKEVPQIACTPVQQ